MDECQMALLRGIKRCALAKQYAALFIIIINPARLSYVGSPVRLLNLTGGYLNYHNSLLDRANRDGNALYVLVPGSR